MRNVILIALILAGAYVKRGLVTAMLSPAVTVSESIPADFPGDLPLPKGAECKQSSKMAGTSRVEFKVKQSAADVARFYENELPGQGWEVERMDEDVKQDKNLEGVVAQKSGHFLAAMIAPLDSGSSELVLVVK